MKIYKINYECSKTLFKHDWLLEERNGKTNTFKYTRIIYYD